MTAPPITEAVACRGLSKAFSLSAETGNGQPVSETQTKKPDERSNKMNEHELQQLEALGARHCETMGALMGALDSAEARMHFLKISFDAVLVQLVRQRGLAETSAFLRRAADHIDSEARKTLQ